MNEQFGSRRIYIFFAILLIMQAASNTKIVLSADAITVRFWLEISMYSSKYECLSIGLFTLPKEELLYTVLKGRYNIFQLYCLITYLRNDVLEGNGFCQSVFPLFVEERSGWLLRSASITGSESRIHKNC